MFRSEEKWQTLSFLLQVFFLGLIGVTIAQNLSFVGLSYSSPIVACGMVNQMPALSFILAIILSIVGAFICGVGYYTVLWGQIKDEEISKSHGRNKIGTSSTDTKVPLLQQDSQV